MAEIKPASEERSYLVEVRSGGTVQTRIGPLTVSEAQQRCQDFKKRHPALEFTMYRMIGLNAFEHISECILASKNVDT